MKKPGKCPKCGMDLVKQQSLAAPSAAVSASSEPTPKGYACAMNCVPPLPKPGKCPICGMAMQPIFDGAVSTSSTTGNAARQLTMTHEARALAAIQTSPVERRWAERAIDMVGMVDHDETRLAYITAYVGGRLDNLFVDYTGTLVRPGDHMAEIYSPDLLTAQEELFQARDAVDRLGQLPNDTLRRATLQALESSRERLRLWGLTREQIEAIENNRKVEDHITLYAPIGGIVIAKNVQEGGYVATGDRIYTISDLSHLWVKLKAYESDLPWLRYGQDVAFTAEALPGEEFHGRISFITPTLDTMTRTVDIRVNVDNSDGRLKPGMYVRARSKSRLARGGKTIAPDLAGKWISPMHPEIIKDGPGACDVCGMALVPVEKLGYVAAIEDKPPLVIPATAPLITGRRAVVYVEIPDAAQPVFEGREVTLGPRAGDYYLVIEGLREGERVVTNGAFKIDSSLQIIAKPSMMSPEGGRAMTGHEGHGSGASGAATAPAPASSAAHRDSKDSPNDGDAAIKRLNVGAEFRQRLTPIFNAYMVAQSALAGDDFDAAKAAFASLNEAASALKFDDQSADVKTAVTPLIGGIAQHAATARDAAGIAAARETFETLSDSVLELEQRFGHAGNQTFRLAFCPMAFGNKGADWLQTGEEIANPYFGAEMLTCGVVKREFKPAASDPAADAHAGHQH